MVVQGLRVSGSPRCATCGLPPIARDAEERLMVEVAKQQLLDKLHLKERPNITQAVPRAALLTALRKLHSGRVRQDGTLELENNLPSKDQGYELVSFADISKFGGRLFPPPFIKNLWFPKFAWRSNRIDEKRRYG